MANTWPGGPAHEAAYCYPAHAVPVEAVVAHVRWILDAERHDVQCPVTGVPLRRIDACFALTSSGVTICSVCQACSTPGDPLPPSHWDGCPHTPSDLGRLNDKHGPFDVLWRKWSIFCALNSVSTHARHAALHMLDVQEHARGADAAHRWFSVLRPPDRILNAWNLFEVRGIRLSTASSR